MVKCGARNEIGLLLPYPPARIPSLAEYVTRAKEIDMPLLIEIKMGGLDTPDHVDLLVEELTELDALQGNTFHSLDHASVDRSITRLSIARSLDCLETN